MNTFKLNIITQTRTGDLYMQVIEYRSVRIVRQFSRFDYLVTVEYQGEECDFNHLVDALKWVEDTLNHLEQFRCYRSDADLHREWTVR